MAPSGTVEVCRGPDAPRDASGANQDEKATRGIHLQMSQSTSCFCADSPPQIEMPCPRKLPPACRVQSLQALAPQKRDTHAWQHAARELVEGHQSYGRHR